MSYLFTDYSISDKNKSNLPKQAVNSGFFKLKRLKLIRYAK